MQRRTCLGGLAGGIAAPWLCTGHAQPAGYPNRPISLLVPYPAGGSGDTVARLVSGPLSEKLGQTVVVENLGGASGMIAAQRVVNAPADGHLLYLGTLSELVLAPMNVPSIRFTSEDFRLIQTVTWTDLALMARKGLPADSVDAFLDYAAAVAKQGKPLTYGTVGIGSIYHLLGVQLSQLAGIEMTHVPYRGGGPAEQALLAEEIDFVLLPILQPQVEFHARGRFKILAVLNRQRLSQWPDLPAIAEFARVKDLVFTTWGGFFIKQGTPEPIAKALNQVIAEVLRDPRVDGVFVAMGRRTREPLDLAQSDHLYQEGITQFRAVAKVAGIL